MTQSTYGRKPTTIDKLLASPVARKAAELVTKDALSGLSMTVDITKEERLAAWMAVQTVCLNSQDDDELNRWWRWVMPDAGWKTAADLHKFAQWKVCDIRGTKGTP